MVDDSYIKIISDADNADNFHYKEGLNEVPEDEEEFYFTKFKYFTEFLTDGCLIADIEIPEGQPFYEDSDRHIWKSHKIIIKNIRLVADLSQWEDPEFCLESVKKNGISIAYVHEKNLTESLCIEAVKQCGDALCFTDEEFKTDNVCVEAVKKMRTISSRYKIK